MSGELENAVLAMMEFDAGDPRRIQHFLKVHAFARLIGLAEGLDGATQRTLELAAVVHDIGIRPAEAKYGRCDGKLQEQEGPAPARTLLRGVGADDATAERAAFLVGHHHTLTGVDGPDWQILLEADFLVNCYEDGLPRSAAETALERLFRTGTGKRLLRLQYGI